MEDWLAEIDEITPPFRPRDFDLHYTLHPHARHAGRDAEDRLNHYRFSCAGFVYEAYRAALSGRHFLSIGELTRVGLHELIEVEPSVGGHADHLEKVLDGPEPWPILFPGYIIHALARAASESELRAPRIPNPAERCFP